MKCVKNQLTFIVPVICILTSIILFASGTDSRNVFIFWITGIVLFSLNLFLKAETNTLKQNLFIFNYKEIVLVIIICLAMFLRIYKLALVPLNIDGDYASHGLQARELVKSGFSNLISFGWANIPIFGFLPSALSMRFFGDNLIGFNLINVYIGLLSIIGVYLIGKEISSKNVGIFAAFFCSVSYVHIHFSRTAEYIDPLLPIVYGLYFFIRGIKTNKNLYVTLSGIISSFGMLTYFSGRILIVIVFLYSLFHAKNKSIIKKTLLWIFIYIFALGPYLVLFVKNTAAFNERTSDVFLLNPHVIEHLTKVYETNNLLNIMIEQVKRTFLMFFAYRDKSTQFGYAGPFLDAFSSFFMLLGLLITSNKTSWLIITTSFFTTLILGGVLTNNATFWPRLVSLTIYTSLFAGEGFNALYTRLFSYMQKYALTKIKLHVLVIVCFFIFIAGNNWYLYIKSQSNNLAYFSFVGRYIMNSKEPIYLISSGEINCKKREIEFLARSKCFNITLKELLTAPTTKSPILMPQDLYNYVRAIQLNTGFKYKIVYNPSNKSDFMVYFWRSKNDF